MGMFCQWRISLRSIRPTEGVAVIRSTAGRIERSEIRRALVLLLLSIAAFATTAHAERVKDLATLQGVRNNQLSGYGIVVGLDGTGDQTTQTPFTVQSIASMLGQMGVNLPPGQQLQLKNVAAVMVTAVLPPFAQPGQEIDVTVSSIGNAKSLRGGTLLMTPLKGADNRIYAMAQGNLLVGGAGASAGGSSRQINHLLAGRISNGATVEREVPTLLGQGEFVALELTRSDFANAARIVTAVNRAFGDGLASAQNGRVVRVRAPLDLTQRVAFIAALEDLDIATSKAAAKVIINARTGSVVMNQTVTLEPCAIAHGSLSVVITSTPVISQPNPFGQGQTVATQRSDIDIRKESGQLVMLQAGVSLAEVVKALNAVGVTPQDLLVILQAMKSAGSLRADLEII
ncbi:MAG: flagellar basal body P-ring protein FlgI [Burkholderiaceae bacterium]|nr:flagellar basal body P-ring protein FlgI [Burkholderiaceae bacterium]